MAKYLIKASYSPDGLKGVMKAGGTQPGDGGGTGHPGRRRVACQSFHFAFERGTTSTSSSTCRTTPRRWRWRRRSGSSAPNRGSYETVVLLTPSEVDKAMDVSVDYRATRLLTATPSRSR